MLLQEGGVYKAKSSWVDYIRITNVAGPDIAVGYIIFHDGTCLWSAWDAMGMCEEWPDYEINHLVGLIQNPVGGDGGFDEEAR